MSKSKAMQDLELQDEVFPKSPIMVPHSISGAGKTRVTGANLARSMRDALQADREEFLLILQDLGLGVADVEI